MKQTPTAGWIRVGLFALPVYGLLIAYSTWKPQPDLATDAEGWAHFVSSTSYLVSHVLGNVLGTALVIFGTFALGAFLASSRHRALACGAWCCRSLDTYFSRFQASSRLSLLRRLALRIWPETAR